jgi:type I protein arginine methyltransferase
MYAIDDFGDMIADAPRMDAYARALREAVRPGSVVVDIGTGTGIMALLACKYGARKVYAIEMSNAIQFARETAKANGFADRIVFFQERSTDVSLPERADVMVSDLRGILPLYRSHIPDLIDARRRFLAPGGILIPRADTIWLALAAAPNVYHQYLKPWTESPYGLDMRAGARCILNTWWRRRLSPENLVTEPRQWARLDYAAIESPHIQNLVRWNLERPCTSQGFCLWFDAELSQSEGFSNAPGTPIKLYNHALFPWPEPVALEKGDAVEVRIDATFTGEDYVWTWETTIRRDGETPDKAVHFRQSTFLGTPIDSTDLARRAVGHAPALNTDGEIVRFFLENANGMMPLGEIARLGAERFPNKFPSQQEALNYLSELSARYSR